MPTQVLKCCATRQKVADQAASIHAVFVHLLRRQSRSLHCVGKSLTSLNLLDPNKNSNKNTTLSCRRETARRSTVGCALRVCARACVRVRACVRACVRVWSPESDEMTVDVDIWQLRGSS